MTFPIIATLIALLISSNVIAETGLDFNDYMEAWDTNIALATKYLKNAETEFKNGDALQGCVEQRKAAGYGISATESLIRAFQLSGSTDDLSGVRSGLAKWKELRDFCG